MEKEQVYHHLKKRDLMLSSHAMSRVKERMKPEDQLHMKELFKKIKNLDSTILERVFPFLYVNMNNALCFRFRRYKIVISHDGTVITITPLKNNIQRSIHANVSLKQRFKIKKQK